MTFASLLTILFRDLDEQGASDSEVASRVKDWVNDILAEISQHLGISGLQVEGYADFLEGNLSKALTIASAHNGASIVTTIDHAYAESYKFDVAWVTTGSRYPLEEITYSDYLSRMTSSTSTGTPRWYALAFTDSSGQPSAYLYPPPDSEDTEDATGRRWRFNFFGGASLGRLTGDSDVVYPVGCEHIIIQGLTWKQAAYDKDHQGAIAARTLFEHLLKSFKSREHAHAAMYIFGRPQVAEPTLWPQAVDEVLPAP